MSDAERLARILADCWERAERGDPVDPRAVALEHPDLAEELLTQLAALEVLDRTLSRDAAPEAPDTLGRFRIVREIGRGGMGVVYEAHDPASGETVALKVLHDDLAGSRALSRFLREAELGRTIRHPNVVRTLEAGEFAFGRRRAHFLVMEYVEGRTLLDLLEETGRVPEDLCRLIGREVANGLAAVHAAGVVHRDIKPENVLITKTNEVKVTDLGVARLRHDAVRMSRTGAFVGSLPYGAPEQFRPAGDADDVDGRADLHALGVLLYELSTGRNPFQADDLRAVVDRVLHAAPRPAGELNPQLSPLFEELLAHLLEKDRDRRPPGAAEVARILDEGERSAWWTQRTCDLRAESRSPLRRIRMPRETTLHGREEELARLRSLFDRALVADEGQVVLIEGEAGIGKSRLLDEFAARLASDDADMRILHGSHAPGGTSGSRGAFAAALVEHFGAGPLGDALREHLRASSAVVPSLAAYLRGEPPPRDDPALTDDARTAAFVAITQSLAAQAPLVIVVEDLHFAPPEELALFAALARGAAGHRILLVGSARFGLPEAWFPSLGPRAARLVLPRLGPRDLGNLLQELFRSARLAEELGYRILTKSDGNPFFALEIVRGLREGRLLERRPDGTWQTTQAIRDIAVPGSLAELLRGRIAALSGEDRALLEAASCCGFEFDPRLVADALGKERIATLQRLGRLEMTDRVVRAAGPRFVFDHHLVQELLYGGLSEPLREEYHAAMGRALEARTGAAAKEPKDLAGALCVDLAEHFLRGGEGARAMRYLDAALSHLAYVGDAAVRLVDRALAVPGLLTGRERFNVLLRKCERLDTLGRVAEVRAVLDEMIALADADGDLGLRSRAWARIAWHFQTLSRLDEAESAIAKSLACARDAGDPLREGVALGAMASLLMRLRRHREAHAHFERRLDIAVRIGDRIGEALALHGVGRALWAMRRPEDALPHVERAAELQGQEGNRRGDATAILNLGMILLACGRLADARSRCERGLGLVREIGFREGEAAALGALGAVLARLGRSGDARSHLEGALAAGRELGDRFETAHHLRLLASLADDAGEPPAAESLFAEALDAQRAAGPTEHAVAVLTECGAFLARCGRTAEARSVLGEAMAAARRESEASALLPAAVLATLPGGDAAPVLAALAEHEAFLATPERMEARFFLWRATRDPAHLAHAKRLLDLQVADAPQDCRGAMIANVRLHREIAEEARSAGL